MALQEMTGLIQVNYPVSTQIQTAAEWDRNYRRKNRDTNEQLPKDPRDWSRENVAYWLNIVADEHNLPDVSPNRFQMNGKALCLMSLEMFQKRVPFGAKLLYKDFQMRLCSALYSQIVQ